MLEKGGGGRLLLLLFYFFERKGGSEGIFSLGQGGEVSVGMLMVVIPRRKRNYFILHFPTSNLYNCRIAVTSYKSKDVNIY